MTVIKEAAATDELDKPSYLSFEDVIKALSLMRMANNFGFACNNVMNRPDIDKKIGTGVLLPYARMAGETLRFYDADASTRTNASAATINAIAVALAPFKKKKPGDETLYSLPQLAGQPLPAEFVALWQLANKSDGEWFRGAARALQKFNLGDRVMGNQVRRGDVIQLNYRAHDHEKGISGHSVFCYHARRISDDETRFLIASAQIETFGVGVRLNAHSTAALMNEAGYVPEPVQVSKSPFNAYVDHPEVWSDFSHPEYVARAIQHGHYYIANAADGDGAGESPVTKLRGGFAKAWVGRPRRPFPYFPLPIQKQRSFALIQRPEGDNAESREGIEKQVAELYYRNTETNGGTYPIGLNRSWHGGVHLFPQDAHPDNGIVRAAFDGRVVCARLAKPSKKDWPLGSGNFVLLKHSLKIGGAEKEFYSLYMHLAQVSWKVIGGPDTKGQASVRFKLEDEDGDAMSDERYRLVVGTQTYEGATNDEGRLHHFVEPETETGQLTFFLDDEEFTFQVKIERPEAEPEQEEEEEEEDESAIEPNELLAYPWLRDIVLAPEVGTPEANLDPDKLYLKVITPPSSGECKLGDTDLEEGDVVSFDPTDADGLAAWYGKKDGPGELVLPEGRSGSGTFPQRSFPKGGLIVHDAYPARYAQMRQDLSEGKVVDLWEEGLVVHAGDPLCSLGAFGAEPKSTLHFEIFSADFIECWTDKVTIDAPDAKLFASRKDFFETFFEQLDTNMPELEGMKEFLVDGQATKNNSVITQSELKTFYKENSDARHFRDIVAKFPSEWSDDAKWDQFDSNAAESYGYLESEQLKEFKDKVLPYVWWDSNLSSAGLPSSKSVVHYHPIRFMEWVDEQRVADSGELHESIAEGNHKVG